MVEVDLKVSGEVWLHFNACATHWDSEGPVWNAVVIGDNGDQAFVYDLESPWDALLGSLQKYVEAKVRVEASRQSRRAWW